MGDSLVKFTDYSPENYGEQVSIWRYINFLYCIELLRNSNVENIGMQVAWQYGQVYSAPWKDNNHLVYNFLCTHKDELRAFVIQKYNRLVDKLLAETKNFKSPIYLKVALTPHLLGTISSALQEVQTDDNLMRSFISEATVNGHLNPSASARLIRHYRGAFTGIELADRSLQGYFDMYPGSQYEQQHQHEFGPNRVEIFDNRVYTCICWLKEQLVKAAQSMRECQCFCKLFELYNEFFHLYASIFSTMFRLVIPYGMHPNRLDRMYEKYFICHPDYARYLAKARMWSILVAEDVAGDSLPLVNCDYLNDTILADLDPKKMVKFSYTVTYPDSLIEKYLVTQFFMEHQIKELRETIQ